MGATKAVTGTQLTRNRGPRRLNSKSEEPRHGSDIKSQRREARLRGQGRSGFGAGDFDGSGCGLGLKFGSVATEGRVEVFEKVATGEALTDPHRLGADAVESQLPSEPLLGQGFIAQQLAPGAVVHGVEPGDEFAGGEPVLAGLGELEPDIKKE